MVENQLALQQAVEPSELAQLEAQWGAVVKRHCRLEVDDPFLTGDHQMLVSDGRRAEICYVMHRGNPADGLLLHIKTIYPAGAYRLPTGGIQQGEAVHMTLAREITEETGLVVGSRAHEVKVRRFLGLLSYQLAHRALAASFEFATYFFLVEMPVDGVLAPQDATEMIAGWRWCPAAELTRVAGLLDGIGVQDPVWADWGRYRALGHWFVADLLAGS